jgi:hypothetical protein
MNNEYHWDCKNIEVLSSHNGFTDVVCSVNWNFNARNLDDTRAFASTFGKEELDISSLSEETFTSISDLNSQTVAEWVKAKIGAERVAQLKQNLDAMISLKLSPEKKTITLTK